VPISPSSNRNPRGRRRPTGKHRRREILEMNMEFTLSSGKTFHIPDKWIEASGMNLGTKGPQSPTYRCDMECKIVEIDSIEPPIREDGTYECVFGFDKERMISVLRALSSNEALPPICIYPADMCLQRGQQFINYNYCVKCGFHRFYASAAAGFHSIPCTITDFCFYQDLNLITLPSRE
jgi:hypothetical protein